MRDEKLDFWIKNNLNVLIKGHYGVGKTTRIIQAFTRANLSYKYFSAATMDPWVDFIGTPSKETDSKGSYIELILPKDMRDDIYDVFFFDELNRSHKKVRNAIMELIQFKTMNGRPFKRLKMVWAAINPENEWDYQVEPLDKTQIDRFHVHVNVPFEPTRSFFVQKYNEQIANAAISWWNNLPDKEKELISPRRLEYALDQYCLVGGDIRDILTPSSNPGDLLNLLNSGLPIEKMQEFYTKKDKDNAKKYLTIENNSHAFKYLLEPPDGIELKDWLFFFLPLLSTEKLSALISTEDKIYNHITQNIKTTAVYLSVIEDIIAADLNKVLVNKIKKACNLDGNAQVRFGKLTNINPQPPYFNQTTKITDWNGHLAKLLLLPISKTPERAKVYLEIASNIPLVLTVTEAINTLELLSIIVDSTWPAKIRANLPRLTGIINHCIDQLKMPWYDLLGVYGDKIKNMLIKLKEANMIDEIYTPEGLKNDI